jgi:hypothetical protein
MPLGQAGHGVCRLALGALRRRRIALVKSLSLPAVLKPHADLREGPGARAPRSLSSAL